MLSAGLGHLDAVKCFLEHGGFDVNAVDNKLQTPLHAANDVKIVKLLIKKGANIEQEDSSGMTPLLWQIESKEIVKVLIELGVNVNHFGSFGMTPLTWALQLGCRQIAELLIENGAKADSSSLTRLNDLIQDEEYWKEIWNSQN